MMKIILKAILLLALTNSLYAEGMIIANNSVDVTAITSDDVSSLYLGKKKRWDNGDKVVLGYIDNPTAEDEKFYETYVGRIVSKFIKFWVKQVFAGNGTAPQKFNSADEAYNYVKAHKGTITYVPKTTSTDGVKVITVDGKSAY